MPDHPEPNAAMNALLADYVSGRLSPALHTLIASHLELKPDNGAFVAGLEALLDAEMTVISAPPLSKSARDLRLSAIFDRTKARNVEPAQSQPDALLPGFLRQYLVHDFNDIRWRTRLPGLKEYHIESRDGVEASLLWINAGRKMLSHTHDGTEVTLVLKGSFMDIQGSYYRGDVSIADAEVDHKPRAGQEDDCLCFVVLDAPLRLTGPVGRVISRILGH